MRKRLFAVRFLLCAWVLPACAGSKEAPQVELPVFADASGISVVTTDLGYVIELSEARASVENFEFTVAGEVHAASIWQRVSALLTARAFAHPGHLQGGDVTGELPGRFILHWLPITNTDLGTATLLTGLYEGANFSFVLSELEDGLVENDPLLGHTAFLRGRATKDGEAVDFVAAIDAPVGRELIGAPFTLAVKESSRERLGIRLLTEVSRGGATLFDALDFAALDADGDGQLRFARDASEPAVVEAYSLLRRRLQTHDHFDVKPSRP